MKGFDLYREGGNLYRIDRDDNIRMYLTASKQWWGCYASARNVRKYGVLVAKNVVFK